MYYQVIFCILLVAMGTLSEAFSQEGYDLSPAETASGYTYDVPDSKERLTYEKASATTGGKFLSSSTGSELDSKRPLSVRRSIGHTSTSGGAGKSFSFSNNEGSAATASFGGFTSKGSQSFKQTASGTSEGKSIPKQLGGSRAFAVTIPGGGIPGRDYPFFSSVPITSFSCERQPFPGYYADTTAGCQVFHICQFDGRQHSFLCPNGTIFNQQYFVCDWWFNVECSAAGLYIGLNNDIGKVPSGSNGNAATTGGAPGTSGSSSSIVGSQSSSSGLSSSNSSPSSGGKIPEQSFDLPQVTKPSGLYGVPDEK